MYPRRNCLLPISSFTVFIYAYEDEIYKSAVVSLALLQTEDFFFSLKPSAILPAVFRCSHIYVSCDSVVLLLPQSSRNDESVRSDGAEDPLDLSRGASAISPFQFRDKFFVFAVIIA